MSQPPDLIGPQPLVITPATGMTGPRLWVRRLVIWKEPGGEKIRDIPLRPGLNIIWSPDGADADRPQGRVVVRACRQGSQAVLQVDDNGPGVGEVDAAAIFDPFYTTKPVGRGTGLGLSISHKIAEEHGGRLSLCAAPGASGACFRLELPLGDGP